MKKVIVYRIQSEATKEISELFLNRGYLSLFAETPSDLISKMNIEDFSKVYMQIQNLSDIRFLKTIHSLYNDMEINLIIPPQLQDIIELLKNNNFKILNDVTQIQ